MAGVSDGPTIAAPGAVAEDEGRAAVIRVGEVRELLDADHEDVLGAAAADHVVSDGYAVAVAGARRGDVERGALDAEAVGQDGAAAGVW